MRGSFLTADGKAATADEPMHDCSQFGQIIHADVFETDCKVICSVQVRSTSEVTSALITGMSVVNEKSILWTFTVAVLVNKTQKQSSTSYYIP